jgi:hypothetical protein
MLRGANKSEEPISARMPLDPAVPDAEGIRKDSTSPPVRLAQIIMCHVCVPKWQVVVVIHESQSQRIRLKTKSKSPHPITILQRPTWRLKYTSTRSLYHMPSSFREAAIYVAVFPFDLQTVSDSGGPMQKPFRTKISAWRTTTGLKVVRFHNHC